jgi:hypothetical protein
MTQTTNANDRWAAARTLATELATLFGRSAPDCPSMIGLGLNELVALLEALPLGLDEMCYFRNRVESCRQLWDGCERGAAEYQMTEIVHKLANLERAWT